MTQRKNVFKRCITLRKTQNTFQCTAGLEEWHLELWPCFGPGGSGPAQCGWQPDWQTGHRNPHKWRETLWMWQQIKTDCWNEIKKEGFTIRFLSLHYYSIISMTVLSKNSFDYVIFLFCLCAQKENLQTISFKIWHDTIFHDKLFPYRVTTQE